ncbi:MAG: hypothetical protein AB1757_15980 [Acidobacteriota bacterium]
MSKDIEEVSQTDLSQGVTQEQEFKKKLALEALADLREKYHTLPPLDAEVLIREGRDAASRRFEK